MTSIFNGLMGISYDFSDIDIRYALFADILSRYTLLMIHFMAHYCDLLIQDRTYST